LNKENNLSIVLGTGSYGHPVAKKFQLDKGLAKKNSILKSWEGTIKTRLSVIQLAHDVAEILLENGVPVYPISPGNITLNGKINSVLVKEILDNKLVPLLHGDMIFDKTNGTRIYSGDNIIIDLAKLLNADEVHFVTKGDGINIDGLWIKEIKATKLAELLVLKQGEKNSLTDVSYGFYGKIGACLEYVPLKGIRIYDGENIKNFINGFEKNDGGSLITPTQRT
jgi:isopentenyl phosphate kinase